MRWPTLARLIFGKLAELWRREYVEKIAAGRPMVAAPTREKYVNALENHILPKWKDVAARLFPRGRRHHRPPGCDFLDVLHQANEEFVAFDFCLLFRKRALATAGRDGVELPGGCIAAQPLRSIRNQLFGINGGPVATRTPDLYRVKVAL